MAFKIVSQTVTEEEDRNPNLYVKRAEDFLKKGQYSVSLIEINKAIQYSNDKNQTKYVFEAIKTYEAIGKEPTCADFIKKYIGSLYSSLSLNDFYRVLALFQKNSNGLGKVLSENRIPAVLAVTYYSTPSRDYFLENAKDYKNSKQFSYALDCISVINKKYGEKVDSSFLKAQILRAQGSFSEALSCYIKATNMENAQEDVYSELVSLQLELKQDGEAKRWIESGLAKFPNNPELLHQKAGLLFKGENYPESLSTYNEIIALNPKDAKALYMKGLIYDRQKRYPLAKRFFHKAEAQDKSFTAPENPIRDKFLRRRKFLITTASMVVVLLFIGQFFMYTTGMAKPLVNSVTLKTDKVLFVGKTMQLHYGYNLFPIYAKGPKVTCKITNPHIAQISPDGKIKGLKVGTTYVQMVEGEKVLATSEFKVVNPKVESVTIETSNENLMFGDKADVKASVTMDYEQAKAPEVTYRSSDSSILSVDSDGKIEAVGVGKATIDASAGGENASVTIHSYAKVLDIAVNLPEEGAKVQNGTMLTLNTNVETAPLNAEFYPLKYESSDPSIATVSDMGEVTGVSEGETEIVISSLNGVEKRIKVSVSQKPQSSEQVDVSQTKPSTSTTSTVSNSGNTVNSSESTASNSGNTVNSSEGTLSSNTVNPSAPQKPAAPSLLSKKLDSLVGVWKRVPPLNNVTHDIRYIFVKKNNYGSVPSWSIDFESQWSQGAGRADVKEEDLVLVGNSISTLEKPAPPTYDSHGFYATRASHGFILTLNSSNSINVQHLDISEIQVLNEEFIRIPKNEMEGQYLDIYNNFVGGN